MNSYRSLVYIMEETVISEVLGTENSERGAYPIICKRKFARLRLTYTRHFVFAVGRFLEERAYYQAYS